MATVRRACGLGIVVAHATGLREGYGGRSLRCPTKPDQDLTATTKQQVVSTLKLTKASIEKLADVGKLKLNVEAVYTPPGRATGLADEEDETEELGRSFREARSRRAAGGP